HAVSCTCVPLQHRSPLFPYTTLFRSGDWPRGICPGKTRRGLSAAKARTARWGGYIMRLATLIVFLTRAGVTTQGKSRMREFRSRSEEHTSELQSPYDLVCRLPPEKNT